MYEERKGKRRARKGGGGQWVEGTAEYTGHIGSNSGIHLATPQILQSCWTSCSLHNRIRMNRPLPPSLPPSPPPTVLFSLRAAFTLPSAQHHPTHTPYPPSTPDNLRPSSPNQPLLFLLPSSFLPSFSPSKRFATATPRIQQTPPRWQLSFLSFPSFPSSLGFSTPLGKSNPRRPPPSLNISLSFALRVI